jgi:hypothetical protein
MEDVLIIVGMACVGLLWVFSVVGGLHTVWETFREHAAGLIGRLKR